MAEVRHVEPNVGKFDNTVLHLTQEGDPCRMWSNATIDRQLDAADVCPGETIGIKKSEEQYTYETDDGEEREAFDYEV
ncbi:hypothetical protein [Halorarum salinum]|uniref:hypothetical protein n=1 Tax=Halorarum salinum TaxID=2743089 RepID=UPI001C52B981|nr:hypothetical protein [Halobaculum salinum]